MAAPLPGKFITFEGGEGAGKSTQARALADDLRRTGLDVVVTREPGGTPGGEAIRTLLVEGDASRWDPFTEALLHFAARREHVVRLIQPKLAAGSWVISDRFADSTVAYQGAGQGLDDASLTKLRSLVLGDFMPDLTLILDLPTEVGFRRIKASRPDSSRYERMGADFHERLRRRFLDIARQEPRRCVVVDAAATAEAVQAAIVAAVGQQLGVRWA